MNRTFIGRVGLSMAISYFTVKGYTVSLPLNDTQWYDLIVEKEGVFETVQCKCTFTSRQEISFDSSGGTKGKIYDSILNYPKLTYLFCVNKELKCWLIPLKDLKESNLKGGICLRTNKSKYSNKKSFDTSIYLVDLNP